MGVVGGSGGKRGRVGPAGVGVFDYVALDEAAGDNVSGSLVRTLV